MSAETETWEPVLVRWAQENMGADPAHDAGHVLRVWRSARALLAAEGGGDGLVVLASSLLHDAVNVPKGHPDRCRASVLAAERAVGVLAALGFPPEKLPAVRHAVEAHSFSGGIEPTTLEAKVVRDADRLDSLGAVGVARCFVVSGLMGRPIACPEDPLAEARQLDDYAWTLDHFEVKLLRLPGTMATAAGREAARRRAAFLAEFRDRLVAELRGEG